MALIYHGYFKYKFLIRCYVCGMSVVCLWYVWYISSTSLSFSTCWVNKTSYNILEGLDSQHVIIGSLCTLGMYWYLFHSQYGALSYFVFKDLQTLITWPEMSIFEAVMNLFHFVLKHGVTDWIILLKIWLMNI